MKITEMKNVKKDLKDDKDFSKSMDLVGHNFQED